MNIQYIYIYIYTCIHIYIRVCMCMCVCVYVCCLTPFNGTRARRVGLLLCFALFRTRVRLRYRIRLLCCSVLQCVAFSCSALLALFRTCVCLRHPVQLLFCSVLQCVPVSCNELQLQCVVGALLNSCPPQMPCPNPVWQ